MIDREEAIAKGISLLKEDDILLLLGKGNEDYIEINQIKYPFKDREIAEKYLKNRLYNL